MRTKGAKDLKKRKTRSDKKNKYVKRNGKLVLYKSKRKKDDPIKIRFFEKRPMSYEGYKRWSKGLRIKIKRFVFYPIRIAEGKTPYVLLIDPLALSTIEDVEQLAIGVLQYPGDFQLRMPTHSKNTYHVAFKKKADIKITETEEGLKARVSNYSNLSRYWFFQSSRRKR